MLSRDEIKTFLTNQKDNTKEEVLMNFMSYAIVNGVSTDKIGRLVMDLRSYPEWKWGE
jgi:hypothetical protein